MPEIIDTVFANTSPKRAFSMTEYERFGLVFTKTRVYKFGHGNATGGGAQRLALRLGMTCVIPHSVVRS